jgi:hypothetical protein
MATKAKSIYWRAAIWATAIVAPTSAFYYWEQVASASRHGAALDGISSVCGIALVPGALLVSSLVSLLAPGFMENLSNFGTIILIILGGGAVCDWLLYFGVLLLIFRWRQRRAARAASAAAKE